MYHYVLALVIILCIVFVSDIQIFNNPYMMGVLYLMFIFNALFVCKDNIAIGMLFAVLFVIAYVRFTTKKTRQYYVSQ